MLYRGAYQLGLTVDGYGDGLLIVCARPRTAKSHHGGGNVVVTTYGLDDAAFGSVQDRWKTMVGRDLRGDRDPVLTVTGKRFHG